MRGGTGARRRRNNETARPSPPPEDISEEILTKLQLTSSLCRCKCVSKLWSSLVIDNFYRSQRPPIICRVIRETGPIRFCSIDGNTGIVTPDIYNPTDLGEYKLIKRTNCSNGFVCFSKPNDKTDMLVFNPATEEKLVVPNPKEYQVSLGFDPCSKKIKVFGWIDYSHQCEIYTLEMNSSWRTVTSKPIQGSGSLCWDPFCMNGTIYWYSDTGKIISFNLATESFGLIQGPNRSIARNENLIWSRVYNMFELDECLCLAVTQDHLGRIMELWMLKDYGNMDSRWVMMATVNKPLGRSIVWTNPYAIRTGEILLAQCDQKGSQSFYLYSLLTRQFHTVNICGPDCYSTNYVENLATPKGL